MKIFWNIIKVALAIQVSYWICGNAIKGIILFFVRG